jgi:Flp pilus assembly protein TadG
MQQQTNEARKGTIALFFVLIFFMYFLLYGGFYLISR